MKKTLLLLFVCLFVGISHAQAQVTVKGTVISSENNEPVIGASVLVKGTTNGTITDINGKFTLTNISPTNKTIIVSFIGMETQEVTIKPEMKIVMTSIQGFKAFLYRLSRIEVPALNVNLKSFRKLTSINASPFKVFAEVLYVSS